MAKIPSQCHVLKSIYITAKYIAPTLQFSRI